MSDAINASKIENLGSPSFDKIENNREALSWILEKHAELRSELLAFYKKDLKEIHAALQDLGQGGEISNIALKAVQENFLEYWKESYRLITPNL